MAADISVAMSVQGEKEFKRALEDCKNQLKQLDSGLKANAAEYANNADAMGDNVERTRMLRQSIETQQKMVKSLGEAIDFSTEKYGANSRQTTQYVVQQNRAREAIAKLERELKDSDREMEELGRDSIKVGRQLENGIGDAAEDTARSLDDMIGKMSSDIAEIKGFAGISAASGAAGVVMKVGEAVVNAAQALDDFEQETRDYTRQMSFLELNARNAGVEWGLVNDELVKIWAIAGDEGEAFETLSNLLQMPVDDQTLVQAIDALAGAVISFPGTMQFTSLADSLQETVSTKTATGQYAELLGRMGISVEDVNKALAQCTTEQEALQVVLSFIAHGVLPQATDAWEKQDEGITNATEADKALKDAYKEWGTVVRQYSPYIKQAYADFLMTSAKGVGSALGDWSEKAKEEGGLWKGYARWIAESYEKNVAKPYDTWAKSFSKDFAEDFEQTIEDAKEWRAIPGAIGGFIKGLLEKENDPLAGADLTGINEGVMLWGDEAAAEMESEAKAVGEKAQSSFWEGVKGALTQQQDPLAGTDLTGINEGVMLWGESVAEEMETEGEEAGTTGGEAVIDGAAQALEDGGADMKTALSNALIEGAAAFGEATPGMTAAAQTMANAISAALSTIQFPDVSGWFNNASKAVGSPLPITMPTPGGAGANVRQTSSATINLSVNGSRFASAIIDDINAAQGKTVALA